MKTISLSSLGAFTLAAVFAAPTAGAAEVEFDTLQQAGGVCQPAREYPDVRVRQREIDNIGTTNAYIVCAPEVFYTGGRTTRIFIRLLNSSASEKTVNCTLQNGWLPNVANVNSTKQVILAANDDGSVQWSASDFGFTSFDSPGVQCILPGDVSLAYVYTDNVADDIDTQ